MTRSNIDETRLRALVKSGHTIADIAEHLGVSVSALNWHIRSDVILRDALNRIRRHREPERPDTPWMADAACVDTTIDMFASDRRGLRAAKRLCHRCPVEAQCLRYALDWEPYGVWGGQDEKQRQATRRTRRKAS